MAAYPDKRKGEWSPTSSQVKILEDFEEQLTQQLFGPSKSPNTSPPSPPSSLSLSPMTPSPSKGDEIQAIFNQLVESIRRNKAFDSIGRKKALNTLDVKTFEELTSMSEDALIAHHHKLLAMSIGSKIMMCVVSFEKGKCYEAIMRNIPRGSKGATQTDLANCLCVSSRNIHDCRKFFTTYQDHPQVKTHLHVFVNHIY